MQSIDCCDRGTDMSGDNISTSDASRGREKTLGLRFKTEYDAANYFRHIAKRGANLSP